MSHNFENVLCSGPLLKMFLIPLMSYAEKYAMEGESWGNRMGLLGDSSNIYYPDMKGLCLGK